MSSSYISFLINRVIDEEIGRGDSQTSKPNSLQVHEVGKRARAPYDVQHTERALM